MKKEDIVDGVGEIDEKIVADTAALREKKKGSRRTKILFSVIAAVLVLSVAAGAVGVLNVTGVFGAKNRAEDAPTLAPEPTAKSGDKYDSSLTKEVLAVGGAEGEGEYGEPAADVYAAIDGAPRDGVEYGEGPAEIADGEPAPGEPVGTGEIPGESFGDAFVLTAAEYRDLDNWPFFMNLVTSDRVSFPAYGLDPTRLCRVTVTDADGSPLAGEKVDLSDGDGTVLFTAVTDKNGKAYLFWEKGVTPDSVACGDSRADVTLKPDTSGEQGSDKRAILAEDVTLTVTPAAPARRALQVSFIIDTTGSMGDELAYLQKDFSSIADEVGADGVFWSVNFYRDEGDEYVTKCNPFTDDVDGVKALLAGEFCDGGGDFPEAVDRILADAITNNGEWADDCEKIAFLIFDASPHAGTEDALVEAIRSAASRGIRIVPVVASGSQRDTELFGRAAAILTGGTYVFLTDDSGVSVGGHLEPIVGEYKVELLHDVIVRIINEYKAG